MTQPASPPAIPILVFAKLPRAGFSKTRLAHDLQKGGWGEQGPERAALWAQALLRDTLRRLAAEQAHPVMLFGTERHAADFQEYRRAGQSYHYQGSGDLGARMQRAFERVFEQSAAPGAVALGADTPHLPMEWLQEACTRVAAGELVIGPAHDGGYYLLALPRGFGFPRLLFEDVPWGTDQVLPTTRSRLEQAGESWHEVPVFWDIDGESDLVQWRQQLLQQGLGANARDCVKLLGETLPRPRLPHERDRDRR